VLLGLHTIFSNKEELENVPLTKGSELTTHNQITVMRGEQQRDHIQIIQLDDMDHIYKGKITAASSIARHTANDADTTLLPRNSQNKYVNQS